MCIEQKIKKYILKRHIFPILQGDFYNPHSYEFVKMKATLQSFILNPTWKLEYSILYL